MSRQEAPEYVQLFLTFNESIYLAKILNATKTMCKPMLKFPISDEVEFVIGSLGELAKFSAMPMQKDNCHQMLVAMQACLEASLSEFLDTSYGDDIEDLKFRPDDGDII